MSNRIILLAGFSACGKDTTADALVESGFNKVISHTTRPIRDNETAGESYHFSTKNKFLSLVTSGEIFEYRVYNTLVDGKEDTWYYGTASTSIDDDSPYVCVIDIQGVKAFKDRYGDRVVSFYLEVNDDIRKERSKIRGNFDKTEWDRRLADDKSLYPKEVIDEHMEYVIQDTELKDVLNSITSTLKDLNAKH